jgi:hypothetical protein
VLSDLTERLGASTGAFSAADVFASLAGTHASFSGLSYAALALRGMPIVDAEARGLTAQTTAV